MAEVDAGAPPPDPEKPSDDEETGPSDFFKSILDKIVRGEVPHLQPRPPRSQETVYEMPSWLGHPAETARGPAQGDTHFAGAWIERELRLDEPPYRVAILPDGRSVAYSFSRGLAVWSLRERRHGLTKSLETILFPRLVEPVMGTALALHRLPYFGVPYERVAIYHLAVGLTLGTVGRKPEPHSTVMTISGDQRRVVIGRVDGKIEVLDARRPDRPRVPRGRGHRDRVTALASNQDGRVVVSGGGDGTLWVWDLEADSGQLLSFGGHVNGVAQVWVDGPGRQVVSLGAGGTLRRWEASKTGVVHRLSVETGGDRMALDEAGRIAAVWRSEGSAVELWQLADGDRLTEVDRRATAGVTLSAKGRRMALGTGESLSVWRLEWRPGGEAEPA